VLCVGMPCRYVTAARPRRALHRTIWLRPRRCVPPRLPSVAAVAFASYRCVAPPAVSIQLAPFVISYASSPPVVAFLPRPSTTDVAFASTDIARNPTFAWRPSLLCKHDWHGLWRLPTSSSSSSSSTSWCDRVPFVCAFVAFIIVSSCRRPLQRLLRECRSDAVDFLTIAREQTHAGGERFALLCGLPKPGKTFVNLTLTLRQSA
jgi:hypothetical protein